MCVALEVKPLKVQAPASREFIMFGVKGHYTTSKKLHSMRHDYAFICLSYGMTLAMRIALWPNYP